MEPGERLRAARIARGLSRSELAERVGYSPSGIGALENGQNKIRPDAAVRLGKALGARPDWLLYGAGESTNPSPTVPLVGYVGAGAEAHFYANGDGHLGEVEAPDDATPQTVAVEIRGTSLGPLFENWLVYYDDVRSPVTSDLYGQLCVVGLPNDQVLVKRLRPARAEGLYHLESNSEPTILDQEVAWAAKVTNMKPRG